MQTVPPKPKRKRGFNVKPWPPQKPEGGVEKPRRMFRGLPSAAPRWVAPTPPVDGKATRARLLASLHINAAAPPTSQPQSDEILDCSTTVIGPGVRFIRLGNEIIRVGHDAASEAWAKAQRR